MYSSARLIALVSILAAAIFVCGCETTSPASASAKSPSAAPAKGRKPQRSERILIPVAKVNAIEKGMAAAKVRELLGEPRSIQKYPAGELKGEVWTYRISVVEVVSMIAATVDEVPAYDPISGVEQPIIEPRLRPQTHRVFQTLELLMVEDRLMERKPGIEEDRIFN